MAVQVYTFKVTYIGCEDKIWRVFEVSSNYNLARLGYAILSSFDTMAYHLFYIECNGVKYETAIDNDEECPLLQNAALSKLNLQIGQHLEMVYDFGCEQEFDIELLKIADMPKGTGRSYPRVVDGAGKGIIDDMPVFELMEIIRKTDKNGKSDYKITDQIGNDLIWDYRDYKINLDNGLLKGEIDIIQEGYEDMI